MMRGKFALVLCSVFLLAASCRGGGAAEVGSLTVGREINANHQVVDNITTIPATAKSIYLSGLVKNPTNNTKIKVSWYRLPNFVIATEEFAGNKTSGTRYDYDRSQSSSYFASHIDREGLSWESGEYRADVFLSGRKSGSVFFKVVTDSEAEDANNANLLQSVKFGADLNTDGEIAVSKSAFDRSSEHIYIQVNLAASQTSPAVEAAVRLVGDQKPINTFTTNAGQQRTLVFDLPLERFGRNWNDRLWPAGGYQVEIKLNGTSVATPSFVVE